MDPNRSTRKVFWVLASAALAYLMGGYTASENLWPWPWVRQAKRTLFPSAERRYDPPSLFRFDNIGRLIGKVDSEIVRCPKQDEKTAVIFILGQSNAGNHAGQKAKSEY